VLKKFLPHHDIWEAEYDGAFVKAHKKDGTLDGISTLHRRKLFGVGVK
jgi:hypothetical protein